MMASMETEQVADKLKALTVEGALSEEITVTRNGIPVALLVPIPAPMTTPAARPQQSRTVKLFDQWASEDRTTDAGELESRQQEGDELLRGLRQAPVRLSEIEYPSSDADAA